MEKEEWSPFAMPLTNLIERSSMRCLLSLDSTFQPAPILYNVRLHHFKWQTERTEEVDQMESKVEGLQQTIEEDVELLSLPSSTMTAKVIRILKFLVKAKNEK